MKTKFAYSIVTALVMFFSVSSFAQKSAATINIASGVKIVNERVAVITFQVNNVGSDVAKQKISDLMKTNQSVKDITSTLVGNVATYNVTMDKAEHVFTLQNILVKAGIETIAVDGTLVESKNLKEYVKTKKKNAAK